MLKNVTRDHISHLARITLLAFLCTFMVARVLVFLIMSRRIPDLYLYLGGNHVHHLNYGIFLMSGVGAYLLFVGPTNRALTAAAVIYGIGLALTFDEFGMWLHLGGSYWQRASWDAIVVLSAALCLLAFAPSIKNFYPRHWLIALITLMVICLFFFMLKASLKHTEKTLAPRLLEEESTSPL